MRQHQFGYKPPRVDTGKYQIEEGKIPGVGEEPMATGMRLVQDPKDVEDSEEMTKYLQLVEFVMGPELTLGCAGLIIKGGQQYKERALKLL